jgi:hypothetical protein
MPGDVLEQGSMATRTSFIPNSSESREARFSGNVSEMSLRSLYEGL